MSRTMLSKRLRQLQGSGLVERLDSRYVPTAACEELRPVLLGLGHWAATWIMQDPTEDDCDVELLMWWAHSRFDIAPRPIRGCDRNHSATVRRLLSRSARGSSDPRGRIERTDRAN